MQIYCHELGGEGSLLRSLMTRYLSNLNHFEVEESEGVRHYSGALSEDKPPVSIQLGAKLKDVASDTAFNLMCGYYTATTVADLEFEAVKAVVVEYADQSFKQSLKQPAHVVLFFQVPENIPDDLAEAIADLDSDLNRHFKPEALSLKVFYLPGAALAEKIFPEVFRVEIQEVLQKSVFLSEAKSVEGAVVSTTEERPPVDVCSADYRGVLINFFGQDALAEAVFSAFPGDSTLEKVVIEGKQQQRVYVDPTGAGKSAVEVGTQLAPSCFFGQDLGLFVYTDTDDFGLGLPVLEETAFLQNVLLHYQAEKWEAKQPPLIAVCLLAPAQEAIIQGYIYDIETWLKKCNARVVNGLTVVFSFAGTKDVFLGDVMAQINAHLPEIQQWPARKNRLNAQMHAAQAGFFQGASAAMDVAGACAMVSAGADLCDDVLQRFSYAWKFPQSPDQPLKQGQEMQAMLTL